jgi:hypothetical protein
MNNKPFFSVHLQLQLCFDKMDVAVYLTSCEMSDKSACCDFHWLRLSNENNRDGESLPLRAESDILRHPNVLPQHHICSII